MKLDRRRGAVISVDADKMQAVKDLYSDLSVVLAKASCKGVSRSEIHDVVDKILNSYEEEDGQTDAV